MIVLKDFKTVNQVFTVGQTFWNDIENLEKWIDRKFVAVEESVTETVTHTEVPTA